MTIAQRIAQLGLVAALLLAPSLAWSARPNILLILADDMGVNDLGHTNGNQTHTPRLDQLARSGVSFSRHYTESSCAPSRAALLTGMNPARVGFHPTGLALAPDVTTLPELLKRHGYHTAMFGKWHVGDLLRDDGPHQHGFDEWFGALSHFYLGGAMRNGHLVGQRPVYLDPWLQTDGGPPQRYRGHIDDLLTQRVVDALARKSQAPWFIYVPFLAPHTPTVPSERFAKRYPDTPNGRYRALIEQLDDNVGAILQQLEESGQADNTIVIFAGDNGGTGSAFPSNAPFPGEKASYAEGGIRTPLIVHWPGHWQGGRRIDDAKHIADIYPTLLAALGLQADEPLDGENLFQPRRKPLFWYSQNLLEDSYSMLSADGQWRLRGGNTGQELLRYTSDKAIPARVENAALQEKMQGEFIRWRDAATTLRNPDRADSDTHARFLASAFRPTSSVSFSFMLPAREKNARLIANRQFALDYTPDEFIVTLGVATLRFPHRLQGTCHSLYLNFNVAQDNTIFYGEGISEVRLSVDDNAPIVRKFKIDRIDSDTFAPLSMQDFSRQPAGAVAGRSVAISSRNTTGAELGPALRALRATHCEKH